jgi:hypothetical protein
MMAAPNAAARTANLVTVVDDAFIEMPITRAPDLTD